VAALAILAAAAYWRFLNLDAPGLWLDEILGVRGIGPEHGPVYYAAMRAMTRQEPNEFLTRLPFALAGLAGVMAAFAAGRAASGSWLGIGAASALAASPIHIYYSREARPYALLVLCGMAGVYALAQAIRTKGRLSWIMLVVTAAMAALFVSANGASVAAALLGAAIWTWPSTRRQALSWVAVLLAAGGACSFIVFSIYPPPDAAATWPGVFALHGEVAPLLGPLFSGHRETSPIPAAAWIGLALAASGAVVIGRRAPRLALALGTAALIGLTLPVGLMIWLQHGISARYVLSALPALTLLAAGPLALLDHIDRAWTRDPRWLSAGAVVAVTALGAAHTAARHDALREKADWRRVAAVVLERSSAGDTVIVSNDWTEICLGYYLQPDRTARRLVNVRESLDEAKRAASTAGHALIVSAGTHFTSYAIPRWMEDLPILFRSGRESLQVAFYPDRATYVERAITATEVADDEKRLITSWRSRIDMTVNARAYLLSGWHDAEVYQRDTPFRWADPTAVAYVPVWTRWPREVVTRVRPHPRLIDRTLTVLINGVAVASVVLRDEWTEVRVQIPRGHLKAGSNMIELRTAAPPAPYDRGAKAVQAIELR
jgi:hypothetical protein